MPQFRRPPCINGNRQTRSPAAHRPVSPTCCTVRLWPDAGPRRRGGGAGPGAVAGRGDGGRGTTSGADEVWCGPASQAERGTGKAGPGLSSASEAAESSGIHEGTPAKRRSTPPSIGRLRGTSSSTSFAVVKRKRSSGPVRQPRDALATSGRGAMAGSRLPPETALCGLRRRRSPWQRSARRRGRAVIGRGAAGSGLRSTSRSPWRRRGSCAGRRRSTAQLGENRRRSVLAGGQLAG